MDTRNTAFAMFVGEEKRRKLMRLAKKHPEWSEEIRRVWMWYSLAYRGDRRAWRKADARLSTLWERHVRGG